jgi:hypothetical protein
MASGMIAPAIFVMALYWAARISYAPFFALLIMVPLFLEADFAGCLRLVNIYLPMAYTDVDDKDIN